jgi:[ribosomal protein S18]-alanine N-acetyltransferase
LETTYETATPASSLGMARVYLAAFPESVRHFFGESPPHSQAVADLLVMPLLSEPGCGILALDGAEVVGYCLAPAHISGVSRILWRGHLCRMLGRWVTGRYGLGLTAALRLLRNKLMTADHDAHHLEAHILSIALDPAYQRRGLGRSLLQRGLDYLAQQGASRVRLEVRPDNTGALRLYESFGFVAVGRTRDAQGDWVIMIREGMA